MLNVDVDRHLLDQMDAYKKNTGSSIKWIVNKALSEFFDKDKAIDDQAEREH